jgi:hypothetical protein
MNNKFVLSLQLDVPKWNIKFFKHPGGLIACSKRYPQGENITLPQPHFVAFIGGANLAPPFFELRIA